MQTERFFSITAKGKRKIQIHQEIPREEVGARLHKGIPFLWEDETGTCRECVLQAQPQRVGISCAELGLPSNTKYISSMDYRPAMSEYGMYLPGFFAFDKKTLPGFEGNGFATLVVAGLLALAETKDLDYVTGTIPRDRIASWRTRFSAPILTRAEHKDSSYLTEITEKSLNLFREFYERIMTQDYDIFSPQNSYHVLQRGLDVVTYTRKFITGDPSQIVAKQLSFLDSELNPFLRRKK